MDNKRGVSFVLNADLVDKLDEVVELYNVSFPGVRWTRASVVRQILYDGTDAVLQEAQAHYEQEQKRARKRNRR